ncbi:hypothetical protein [Cerasicoccus arenae]|uniref:Uncharacterized protein n=1 Tax=Cerasicoccus arenae TaxID=424488 RepID=A0A8J3DF42_9BACT|nr:hypothetical protein [Cerasicoccus arenae]MBK1860032.1 hypothetical protein [Cerasicoccus arenae]GHC13877.1 hypothetical protein GCM10007047_33950 [Cerasicoccus arenae]
MLITIIGIIIGIAGSLAIARFYATRGNYKHLNFSWTIKSDEYGIRNPYLFEGDSIDITKDLAVTYCGKPVGGVAKGYFQIANDGMIAISNISKPFTLHYPGIYDYVDAQITLLSDENIDIALEVDKEKKLYLCKV